jgi:hypothetical protein
LWVRVVSIVEGGKEGCESSGPWTCLAAQSPSRSTPSPWDWVSQVTVVPLAQCIHTLQPLYPPVLPPHSLLDMAVHKAASPTRTSLSHLSHSLRTYASSSPGLWCGRSACVCSPVVRMLLYVSMHSTAHVYETHTAIPSRIIPANYSCR